jgi:hypothetical protein
MTYFQEMLESEKIVHFSTKGKNRLTNAKRRHFAVLAKNRKDANRMRFVFFTRRGTQGPRLFYF